MKGPYERLKYDLRRVWECPVCHHRERTPGNRSSMHCECQLGETKRVVPMRLVEDGLRRTEIQPPNSSPTANAPAESHPSAEPLATPPNDEGSVAGNE